MPKGNQSRSVDSYLDSAKRNAHLIPSLRKYRRRKTLNRGEKAVIAKAERQINAIGRNRIKPLNKRQTQSLKGDDRRAVIGSRKAGYPRIQGVIAPPHATVSVRKGELDIRAAGQEFATVPFHSPIPEFDEILRTVKKCRKRIRAKRALMDAKLWQINGFTEPTRVIAAEDDEDYAGEIADILNRYLGAKADQSETIILFGIAGTKINARKK